MAISNRDRVSKGLKLMATGLRPFVERDLKARLGATWETTGRDASQKVNWDDPQTLLGAMLDHWRGKGAEKEKGTLITSRWRVQEARTTRGESWYSSSKCCSVYTRVVGLRVRCYGLGFGGPVASASGGVSLARPARDDLRGLVSHPL
jgi:hypothetical protein